MRYIVITSLLLLVCFLGLCQSNNKDFIDGTIGVGSGQSSFSIHYIKDWRLGKKKKLGIGLGARFTNHRGRDLYFVTAPAELTSGSKGPLVIFKENVTANMDSVQVSSSQFNILNILINFDYAITQKLLVGFNIDFIGFSFGSQRSGKYINGITNSNTEASPSSFNLLLISDNDIGSLNSELYAKYFINKNWGIKAGVQFIFTEYTTKTSVQTFPSENDRFRNKGLLPCIGVAYRL